ncbi:M42 family metallopeptidase [Thermoflavimicrobium daqui]|uniref:Peptidase M28 n=1 Tax=Thermoflavimicrobium daqui TaxID=2137476 RepID=A0A364K8Z5_9BACL|nr:M42 family metallopeptidase [Thermoflavimicrobium daqui]RAL26769.1 peptidase M28 [Thermoflavimicrobium daqui]
MNSLEDLMKELTEADGIPGFEGAIAKKMIKHLTPLSDEIMKDRLGSIVGKKVGEVDGPRILIAGHMDEIGFMVTQITEEGLLKFQSLGYWWPHQLLSQRVKVKSKQGDFVGVIAGKYSLSSLEKDLKKVMNLQDLYIDIGARSKEQVEEWGIRLGDPIVPQSEFFTMNHGEVWVGKAMDNRVGCAIAIEVLRNLQNEQHPNIVFSGATVQEEVGVRGAGTLANLVEPDVAIVVDICDAQDRPSLAFSGACQLGKGPVIVLKDVMMIGHLGLRDLFIDTAKEEGISVQFDALNYGGTDGAKFHTHGIGCPTIFIAVPTRYAHSHNTLMDRSDLEKAIQLVSAVVKKLNEETVHKLFD